MTIFRHCFDIGRFELVEYVEGGLSTFKKINEMNETRHEISKGQYEVTYRMTEMTIVDHQ